MGHGLYLVVAGTGVSCCGGSVCNIARCRGVGCLRGNGRCQCCKGNMGSISSTGLCRGCFVPVGGLYYGAASCVVPVKEPAFTTRVSAKSV